MTVDRAEIRRIVSDIAPADELERTHQAEVLAWIDRGAGLHRLAKPATPPEHLVSYCIAIDPRRRSALLVDHRDAGLWLPTGGHVEPHEHPVEAARRELNEELGLAIDFWAGAGSEPFFVTRTRTQGRSAGHVDISLWYVFATDETVSYDPDPGEFADTRWWPMADITDRPGARFDPHLPRFAAKVTAVLDR